QAQPGISKNECENKYPTQSEISKNECECKNILIISGRNMWGTPFGGMSDAFIDNAMNDIKKKYNL
ncbi:MAG: hypothetical protein Q4C64_03375, partial [Erysipelotrichia bacterium]|nr:hypothetical protein [Erysipelotrichia bacterium]